MGDDLKLLDPNEEKPTNIVTNNSRAGLIKEDQEDPWYAKKKINTVDSK